MHWKLFVIGFIAMGMAIKPVWPETLPTGKALLEEYDQITNQEFDAMEKPRKGYEFKSVPDAVAKDITQYELEDGALDPAILKQAQEKAPISSLYKAQYIDLDGNGVPELLVMPSEELSIGGSAHCGLTWIYGKIHKQYKKLLSACTGGRAHSLLPLDTRTNGYRDILNENDCCMNNTDIIVFKFNGTEYEERISKECVVESHDNVQCKDSKLPLN